MVLSREERSIILGDTYNKAYGLVGNEGLYCRGII